MTRNTVFGVLLDQLGAASANGRFWATPAAEVRAFQDPVIRVDVNHSHRWIGEIVHLELLHGKLWAVAHVDASIGPSVNVRLSPTETRSVTTPMFWSAERIGGGSAGFLFTSVAITASPARVSPGQPLVWLPGELDHRDAARRWSLPTFERDLLTRAANAYLDRRRQGRDTPIIVAGTAGRTAADRLERNRERLLLETRSAQVADVSTSGRSVEIVAAPYNVEAVVNIHGRTVAESFAHTAWLEVNEQANRDRIRVWRDHRAEQAVGRITNLDPFDEAGLIAEFKVSKTRLGDETLELAGDGVLDASVGFNVLDERWEGRNRRRVTKAYLHHLGLTADPAYVGTVVLDVRGTPLPA